MAVLFYLPNAAPVASGSSYPGAKLYFYLTGTSTSATVYTDDGLTTAHANPVVADSSGVFNPIYLDSSVSYRVVLKTSANVTLRDVDPVPAAFSDADSVGAILWPRTAAEISASVTPSDYGYPPGDVRRYGADPTGTDDSAVAIQQAINLGGKVSFHGGTYKILTALTIGTGVDLDLGNATINQGTSNTPIIQITAAALNRNWSIRNGTLQFASQQTSVQTNAVGVLLATTNVTSYLGKLENLYISKACTGVSLPELTGCTAFLVSMENVTTNSCADWGFSLLGDTSGARTNLVLDRCYVLQPAGSEIATSRGIQIKRCQEAVLRNCAVDHIQVAPALFLDTCIGATVESFAAESCDFTATSDTVGLCMFSNSTVTADVLTGVDNNYTISGTSDAYFMRTTDDSRVDVQVLYDSNTAITDSDGATYYSVYSSGTSDIINVRAYKAGGTTPAVAFAGDDGAAKKVRHWNGSDRTWYENDDPRTFGTAAPATGTWTLGAVVWNSEPAATEYVGWVCVSAGTPGTWKGFGAIES